MSGDSTIGIVELPVSRSPENRFRLCSTMAMDKLPDGRPVKVMISGSGRFVEFWIEGTSGFELDLELLIERAVALIAGEISEQEQAS